MFSKEVSMFIKSGSEIFVFCDDKSRTLRVATDAPLFPGFRGILREIATFKTPEEWNSSPFSFKVREEGIREMIDWFWIDMLEEINDKRP